MVVLNKEDYLSHEEYTEIQNEIISILENKKCTVADARNILLETAREIMCRTTVRCAGGISPSV